MISKLASWVIVIVSVLLAVAVTFPSVKPVDLLAGLGFFSVAVGFAFQDILENTLAGVLLLFRQPFRSGDQINVVGQSGTVTEINIRETRITTFDGESVIIPNRDVYKNVILVHTHHDTHRLQFDIGIAYDNDADTGDQRHRRSPRPPSPASSTIHHRKQWCTSSASPPSTSAPCSGPTRGGTPRSPSSTPRSRPSSSDSTVTGIEMPANIVALQATPSLRAAIHGDATLTPAGNLRPEPTTTEQNA